MQLLIFITLPGYNPFQVFITLARVFVFSHTSFCSLSTSTLSFHHSDSISPHPLTPEDPQCLFPGFSLGLSHHQAHFPTVAAVLLWGLQSQELDSSPSLVTHWPMDFGKALTSLSCSVSCEKEDDNRALSIPD